MVDAMQSEVLWSLRNSIRIGSVVVILRIKPVFHSQHRLVLVMRYTPAHSKYRGRTIVKLAVTA